MKKSKLGLLFGLLCGILGLLGLMACNTPEEKDEFISGWWTAFWIYILLVVIILIIVLFANISHVKWF